MTFQDRLFAPNQNLAPAARPAIGLVVDEPDCRRWLAVLVRNLRESGCAAALACRPTRPDSGSAIERMAGIERRLYALADNLWERIVADGLESRPADPEPLWLSLTNAPEAAEFRIHLDGERGIGRLGESLLNGHVPFVEILDPQGQVRAAGLPAVEDPTILGRALDQFARRLATLIRMALDGASRHPLHLEGMRAPPLGQSPLRFLGGTLARKVTTRFSGLLAGNSHWRVGIRAVREPFQWQGDQHLDGFSWLADDGARFYADPVLWTQDGRHFLFVEEFPYASGRGIISFTELAPDGRPLFTPRPVIERATHLSYPFLFRHDGAIYMIPENSAEGHLPLYKAKAFPDHWEDCGALIEGVGLHDATLLEHGGRWWIIANEAREGGSSWDCLCLYHAPGPLGPYEPHPANPVLVDARLARSAGPILQHAGKLIRPVQNCLGGYGRFLRFAEITALSSADFRQEERGRLWPRRGSRITGVHSYGRNDRFEVIDTLGGQGLFGRPE